MVCPKSTKKGDYYEYKAATTVAASAKKLKVDLPDHYHGRPRERPASDHSSTVSM